MSSRTWHLRVQDILEAIVAIQNRVTDLSFNDFQPNETIAKAVFIDKHKRAYFCGQ